MNIEDLQKILGQMRDKHRTLLVPICSKSFKLVELERCCLSQHTNPGFWTFLTETQKRIKEHPHMEDIWLNKLRHAMKESEPSEFRKFNICLPTTVQGFLEKLVSDYGRPCFYQKVLMAAFKKIGMIPKYREENCEVLLEKLGAVQCIFKNIRLMENHYKNKYHHDPTLIRATLSE